MRQKPLLLALGGAFAFIVLSSNYEGPYKINTANRTGNDVNTVGSCGGTDCHADNAASTLPVIYLTEGSSTAPVHTYVGGKTYTLRIGGSNDGADQKKFGFQLAIVKASNTISQAGTFTAGSNNAVRTVPGGLFLLEHTAPIAGTVAGGTNVYSTTATWTAPPAGTGAVKMFYMLNAVNADSATSGDRPNGVVVTVNEAPVGIAAASFGADIKVYPNPATTVVNIQQANAENGEWKIAAYDVHGILLHTEFAEITNGTLQKAINTASWAAGIYHLQLSKDGQQRSIPVVIQ